MLTWANLLIFYAANVVVWLGIALLYVHFFYDSDAEILGNAEDESGTERGTNHG